MRDAHSASSAKLGKRCKRAWAYRYVEGIRAPEIDWSALEAGAKCTPSQRALALGKAVHKCAEEYYTGRAPRWESLPGQLFATGVGFAPKPSKCSTIEVERALGSGEPPVRVVHSIRWRGNRDLLVCAGGAWLQLDWKTCSDIARWAPTADVLRSDVQAALYTVDACERLGVRALASRWVYMQTKRTRAAMGVDFVLTIDEALAVLAPAAELCRELDAIERSCDAPQNLDACYEYGGCEFHRTAGGPCDAQRSIMSLCKQIKGERTMANLDPALVAKFGAIPQSQAALAQAAQAAQAPGPVALANAAAAAALAAQAASTLAPATQAAPAPAFGAAFAEVAAKAAPEPAKRGRPRLRSAPTTVASSPELGSVSTTAPKDYTDRLVELADRLVNLESERAQVLCEISSLSDRAMKSLLGLGA